jgi:hypothetical protein
MRDVLAPLVNSDVGKAPNGEPWIPKTRYYFAPYMAIAEYLRDHPGDIEGAYYQIARNGGQSRTFIDDTQKYEAVVSDFFRKYDTAKSSQ